MVLRISETESDSVDAYLDVEDDYENDETQPPSNKSEVTESDTQYQRYSSNEDDEMRCPFDHGNQYELCDDPLCFRFHETVLQGVDEMLQSNYVVQTVPTYRKDK